ncbi:uncharacterized protein E5676_scaffold1737G00190 [Cucumis melo var. makuwa]|uniref:Uncharacterized protein n=1 Tax=Cucumis melo var. makuwa TaxID=1194695 RepID=A0A5A7U5Y5_CUCMM|nr:uncharacterized protein E6C27_scaffold673G001730 [Cucumis melo var. makuwa]TYK07748.1 uncharacterized protein E5676_scaffold1737G00190 [Cucumis melo var. makuwa]
MLELQSQPTPEGSQPLSRDEICDQVLGRRPGYLKGLGCTQHIEDSSPDAHPTSDKKTSGYGIPNATTSIGIRDVGRGIPDAMLVMCRKFVSQRISSDVRPDAVNDVEKRYPNVFVASSKIIVR